MAGLSDRRVVDCTLHEILMFHCSVSLRIVLMVQLIVCTVWGLNKERSLTAHLMKAKPKRPQCAHCRFSQSGHLCQSLPLASSYLSLCPGQPFSGTHWHENRSRSNVAKSPEGHANPVRVKSVWICDSLWFIISAETVTLTGLTKSRRDITRTLEVDLDRLCQSGKTNLYRYAEKQIEKKGRGYMKQTNLHPRGIRPEI